MYFISTSLSPSTSPPLSIQTAVGLFNSDVKTHLLLFTSRGSDDYTVLKDRMGALAPEFTGKVIPNEPSSTPLLWIYSIFNCI